MEWRLLLRIDDNVVVLERVVSFREEEGHVVRLVGRMPFISVREIADILGMADKSASIVVRHLRELGFVIYVDAGSSSFGGRAVRRYVLTESGIERLAQLLRTDVATVLRSYPVSLQWRRSLLRRLEALEQFYKVCGLLGLAHRDGGLTIRDEVAVKPVFLWRRTGWIDGTIRLGGDGGPGIRVMRLGASAVRRAMLYWMGSMVESWRLGGVETALVIVPGHTELRLVEGWFRRWAWGVRVFCVTERAVMEADSWRDLIVLRPAEFGSIQVTVGRAFSGLRERYSRESQMLDAYEYHGKALMPREGVLGRSGTDAEVMVGATLNRYDRAMLQAVADWPLALRKPLLGFRAGHDGSLTRLYKEGFLNYFFDGSRAARCVLTDMGHRYLAGRDRSQVSLLRQQWGAVEVEGDDEDGFYVRGVGLGAGARMRPEGGKLKVAGRQLRHLDGIVEFFSLMGYAGDMAGDGLEVLEVLPTHRSERWAQIGKRKRGILPDASFILRVGSEVVPFVLEYERRAIVDRNMAQRLAPYKRYYDAMFKFEDLGRTLLTLVVFERDDQATNFAEYCRLDQRVTRTTDRRVLPVFTTSLERLRGDFWAAHWLSALGGERMRLVDMV